MGKPVPMLWWDISYECRAHGTAKCQCEDGTKGVILVESDHPEYPRIMKFRYNDGEYMEAMIKAEDFIKEVNEGRISFYQVAREFKAGEQK